MIKFDVTTNIYRPLNQVFAFVATPENDFHWQYGNLLSIRISKGEMGIGTLFRSVGNFMGRRMESVYEVTEFEPDQKYGFKAQSGPLASYTLYTFELMKGSTSITAFIQILPGVLFKPNNPAIEKKVRKQYRENLALLKDVLESGPTDSPSETSLVLNRRRSDFR